MLRDEKNIIIKPAKKGGAIVIMDYKDYREGMMVTLMDTTSYASKRDPKQCIKNALFSLINIWLSNGWISTETADFLLDEHLRLPVNYGLPKVHKGTTPLKFTPIVSGSGSSTQPLADRLLTSAVSQEPASLCQEHEWLLDKLVRCLTFNVNWKLATMDISSLYMSISKEASLMAVRYFLSKSSVQNLPCKYLTKCLQFVIESKIFAFERSTLRFKVQLWVALLPLGLQTCLLEHNIYPTTLFFWTC